MQTNLATVIGWVIVVLIGAFGITVLVKIWSGAIDLSGLLSETSGPAGTASKASGMQTYQKRASSRSVESLSFYLWSIA